MKKIALKSLIITFIISAVLGILIILLDLWDDVTSKILLTTISIFGFSIPGLACSTYYEKAENKIVPTIGMIICFISGIYFLILIWDIFYFGSYDEELFLTCILLSASIGHICLLLLVNSKEKMVNYFKNTTIALSIIMDLLLLIIIFSRKVLSWKLLLIIAILIVLGTIVTPLLNKLNSKTNSLENKEDDKYKELDQLKKLLDEKAITKKEYEAEKKKILEK